MTTGFAFDLHAVPATEVDGGARGGPGRSQPPGDRTGAAPASPRLRPVPEAQSPTHPARWADMGRNTAHTLPEGLRLADYEIVAPIGEGGFGIVYLAWDHELEQHVAIKEYLPAVLASRASVSPAVVVKSQRHMQSFHAGMRSFVNEARMLARFDHPSLVRVLHFWEGNGTAYMAMPYYVGPTLARALSELGRAPDEAEILSWLNPLVDALETMHAANCFHRDIAPDNILLTENGPVLLDFGAARRVIDGAGPSPTAVFKPGYAPIEQYGEGASMKQGPWTDVYALASVVHAAITGKPPTPSVERLMGDELRPLADRAGDAYSARFLQAIDTALSLHPRNRPRSMAEFRAQLRGAISTGPVPAARLAEPVLQPNAPRASASVPEPEPKDWSDIDVDALFAQVPDVLPPVAEPRASAGEPAPRVEPSPFVTPPASGKPALRDPLATRLLALGVLAPGARRGGVFQSTAAWGAVGVLAVVGLALAAFLRTGPSGTSASMPPASRAATAALAQVNASESPGAPAQATAPAQASAPVLSTALPEPITETPTTIEASVPAIRSGAVLLDRESVRPHAAAPVRELPPDASAVGEASPSPSPSAQGAAVPVSPLAPAPATATATAVPSAPAPAAALQPDPSAVPSNAGVRQPASPETVPVLAAAPAPSARVPSVAPTPIDRADHARASPETEAVDARGATRASSERVRPTRREARRPSPPVAIAAVDAPARDVDPAPAVQAPRAAAAADPTPNATPCTEILLRASLGPLKAADAALLKKGCE